MRHVGVGVVYALNVVLHAQLIIATQLLPFHVYPPLQVKLQLVVLDVALYVAALFAGLHELPFHVCVYDDTVFQLAFAGSPVHEYVCVFATQLLPFHV